MTTLVPEDRWTNLGGIPGDQALESTPTHRVARRGRMAGLGLLRGRVDDPRWVRPCLLALLSATAVLYLWGLSASGWANAFYAAADQAGTKSWKAFLFGSFDPSNFITVDKTPASLWVMEVAGRIFGFNSWSMLAPQALEGVATVGLVYLTVRRWFTPAAGLLAGAVCALTPVAVLMFRFNNPDSLMVLLVTLAAYATVRYCDDSRARWMGLAGAAIGFAFLAKMLEAFVFVPGLAAVVLVAGRARLRRRIRDLLIAGAAIAISSGWWLLVVQLTPAAARPYIGGSQDNSIWNLMFGYNGFGRLDGNETGSVGGGPAGSAGRWGATGITRLFGSEMGTQVSWLIPAALILLAAGLIVTRRAARTDRNRAGLILWGGWLLIGGLTISLGQGIIHPYYTVALAPAIGGLVGSGAALMWANRERPAARAILALCVAVTAGWAYVLLGRTPHWMPWLRPVVLWTGLVAAAGLVVHGRLAGSGPYGLWAGRLRTLAAGAAMAGVFAAPLAYSLDTARTPHSGALPTAGPAGSSTGGAPGGPGGRLPGGGPGGGFRALAGGSTSGGPVGGPFAGGGPAPGGFTGAGGGPAGGGFPFAGGFPGQNGTGNASSSVPGGPGGNAAGAGRSAGGLLNASTPGPALVALLEKNASAYSWVAAVIGSNQAAGYQLATGDAVMAIGGFNGSDPYPTLAGFEKLVAAGKVHYFIAAGAGGGFGGPGGSPSGTGSAITSWVESHFEATTVEGVTLYDLSAPAAP